MTHDAIGAHARDELGIIETLRARPIQAAFASALSFAVGAAMPLLTSTFAPEKSLIMLVLELHYSSSRFWCIGCGRGRRGLAWAQYA